jgi:HPt (histidine-containing phosphotransfer) domain-containing protein
MKATAPVEAAYDPEMVATLVTALGPDRLAALMGQLGAQIAGLDATDRPALARAIHRLRGTAATLGLPRLAAAIAAIDAVGGEAAAIAAGLDALIDTHAETSRQALGLAGLRGAAPADCHDGATKR